MNPQTYKYDKVTTMYAEAPDPKRKKIIKANCDKFDKLTRGKK